MPLSDFDSSLVFSLPFQESSGTTASDISGNARHFTATGLTFGTDSVAGPGGNYPSALHFTDNTDYLTSASINLGTVTAHTIAFRFKGTSHASTAGYVLGLPTTALARFWQFDDNSGVDGDTVTTAYNTSGRVLGNGEYNTLDGYWHSLALTITGAAVYRVYVDGRLWKTGTVPSATWSCSVNEAFRISSAVSTTHLIGDLCDLRLWTDVVDDAAIWEWHLLAPDPTFVDGVKIAAIEGSWGTTTGDKDFTCTGLGRLQGIKAAMLFGSAMTAAESGSATDSAHSSHGISVPTFATGGYANPAIGETAHASGFTHNVTTNPDGHGLFTCVNAIYDQRISTTTLAHKSDLVRFLNDGIRLNVANAYASKDLAAHILLFAGDAIQAARYHFTAASSVSGTVDTVLSFEPSLLIVIASGDPISLTANLGHKGQMQQTICFVSNDKAGTVRHAGQSVSWNHNDSSTTKAVGQVSDTDLVICDVVRNGTGKDAAYRFSFPNSTTMRCTTMDASTDDPEISVFAFDFGGRPVSVGVMDVPTSTGVQTPTCSPSFGFTPQFMMMLTNLMPAVNTDYTNSSAGSMGISYVTRPDDLSAGNACRSFAYSAEIGASTTNSQSIEDSRLANIPDHVGGTTGDVQADFSAFVSGGLSADFTIVPASSYKWPFFALQNDESAASVHIGGSLVNAGKLTSGRLVG